MSSPCRTLGREQHKSQTHYTNGQDLSTQLHHHWGAGQRAAELVGIDHFETVVLLLAFLSIAVKGHMEDVMDTVDDPLAMPLTAIEGDKLLVPVFEQVDICRRSPLVQPQVLSDDHHGTE